MAQNKPRSVDRQFRVELNTAPAGAGGDRDIVVIAGDEMLPAMQ